MSFEYRSVLALCLVLSFACTPPLSPYAGVRIGEASHPGPPESDSETDIEMPGLIERSDGEQPAPLPTTRRRPDEEGESDGPGPLCGSDADDVTPPPRHSGRGGRAPAVRSIN